MLPNPPKTGRDLFRWAGDIDLTHGVGLMKYLSSWARLQGYPSLWLNWTEEQVAAGYAEGVRKLQAEGF